MLFFTKFFLKLKNRKLRLRCLKIDQNKIQVLSKFQHCVAVTGLRSSQAKKQCHLTRLEVK